MLRKIALAAIAGFWICSSLPAATIILVRHADRSSAMSADAPLSPAGEERAAQLALVLKDSGIRRIFVTELRRTRQTAQPIAIRLHLQPVIIPQQDTNALVTELRKLAPEETVLVVGHANTVPLIVDRLGAGPASPMADSEYDRLTVLFLDAGKARAVTLRYGKPSE